MKLVIDDKTNKKMQIELDLSGDFEAAAEIRILKGSEIESSVWIDPRELIRACRITLLNFEKN